MYSSPEHDLDVIGQNTYWITVLTGKVALVFLDEIFVCLVGPVHP